MLNSNKSNYRQNGRDNFSCCLHGFISKLLLIFTHFLFGFKCFIVHTLIRQRVSNIPSICRNNFIKIYMCTWNINTTFSWKVAHNVPLILVRSVLNFIPNESLEKVRKLITNSSVTFWRIQKLELDTSFISSKCFSLLNFSTHWYKWVSHIKKISINFVNNICHWKSIHWMCVVVSITGEVAWILVAVLNIASGN